MHSYQYRNEQSQKKNRRPHQVSELAEERDPTISPNNHSGKSPPCVYFICLGLGMGVPPIAPTNRGQGLLARLSHQ